VEFVWGLGMGQYAIREKNNRVKIFSENETSPEITITAEGIFGGTLLGIKSNNLLYFIDWDTGALVRRIEVIPKAIYWSQNGEKFIIATENSFYILSYNKNILSKVIKSGTAIPENGIPEAIDVVQGDIQEKVKTGQWVGDCFIYINGDRRLNYFVGSSIQTVAHLDRSMYILGYIPKYNKIFLIDKTLKVVSYTIQVSVINYQTAILQRNFTEAAKIIKDIPESDKHKVAKFLESQGYFEEALNLTTDTDHKFDLAIKLKKLNIAYDIAISDPDGELKWNQIIDLSLSEWNFELAEEAMWKSNDLNGLLMLYTSLGNAQGLEKLATVSIEKGIFNIGFNCLLLLGRLDDCLDLLIKNKNYPEAACFARTYLPSRISEILIFWREEVGKVNRKTAESLADPKEFPNLFEGFENLLESEKNIKKIKSIDDLPSSLEYKRTTTNI